MFKNEKDTCSVLCALTHLSSLSGKTIWERIDDALDSTRTREDICSQVDNAGDSCDEGCRKFVDTVHIGSSRFDCRGMLQKQLCQ